MDFTEQGANLAQDEWCALARRACRTAGPWCLASYDQPRVPVIVERHDVFGRLLVRVYGPHSRPDDPLGVDGRAVAPRWWFVHFDGLMNWARAPVVHGARFYESQSVVMALADETLRRYGWALTEGGAQ